MKRISILLLILLLTSLCLTAGKLKIVCSYPYQADLVQKIGKDRVQVSTLAKGSRDPHFISPKPSHVAKMRQADLLIINGGQLEIGWIPPLIRQSNNPKVRPQSSGFLSLFDNIMAIEKPEQVSRAQGDIHPDGNPHFHLDPHNVLIISDAIADKLSALDPKNRDFYRSNRDAFKQAFEKKLEEWTQAMAAKKGIEIVQYHKLFNYFFKRFGIREVMTIEPIPGIPPASGHIGKVIKRVRNQKIPFIIHDFYHNSRPSKFIAKKTGAKLLILPQDVYACKKVTDIFSLFDKIVGAFTK